MPRSPLNRRHTVRPRRYDLRMKRLVFGAIAVALLLLAAVGCGGSDPDSSSSSDSSSTSAEMDEDTIVSLARSAQGAISCPAFGGGEACTASAVEAKRYLDRILSGIAGQERWMPVFGAVTEAQQDIDTLSVDCVGIRPGTGDARRVADCLSAATVVKQIGEDVEQAINQVHRDGY